MSNFILIGICVLSGMLLRKTNSLPKDAHKGINTWLIYIALPAVSFKYLPFMQFSWEMLFPVGVPFFILVLTGVFVKYYARRKKFSNRTRRTLELASGYSNTSFLGFPMVSAFYGAEYLGIAVIADQAMFLGLSTLGLITAIKGKNSTSANSNLPLILKRLFTFPPFLACVGALTLGRIIDLNPVAPVFDMLSATLAPLALFSVGLQLQFKGMRHLMPGVSFALFYKLLIVPALALLLALCLGLQGAVAKISVFEMAMPTIVSSAIIAEQYGLNSKLINLIIGLGIPLSFASLTLWFFILENIF